MYRIILTDITEEILEPLLREVNGSGGFQSLLRRLQRAYDPIAKTYTLSSSDIEDICRYSTRYKQGGFQDRLRPIMERVNIIQHDLANTLNDSE